MEFEMDIKKLLSTTPETLAREQYDALRQAVVSRLGVLAGLIQRGALDRAMELLFDSPAGDCMGCDNTCVNFDDVIDRNEGGCSADIGDVINKLQSLRKILGVKEPNKVPPDEEIDLGKQPALTGVRKVDVGYKAKKEKPINVWVVMGNDYPSAAFTTEKDANAYIDERKLEPRDSNRPDIHWRTHVLLRVGQKEGITMSTMLIWHLHEVDLILVLIFVIGLMLGRKTVRRKS